MATSFWIVVLGPRAERLGAADLACTTAEQASIFAFCTSSPFGHELWCDEGFLGRFERTLSNENARPA